MPLPPSPPCYPPSDTPTLPPSLTTPTPRPPLPEPPLASLKKKADWTLSAALARHDYPYCPWTVSDIHAVLDSNFEMLRTTARTEKGEKMLADMQAAVQVEFVVAQWVEMQLAMRAGASKLDLLGRRRGEPNVPWGMEDKEDNNVTTDGNGNENKNGDQDVSLDMKGLRLGPQTPSSDPKVGDMDDAAADMNMGDFDLELADMMIASKDMQANNSEQYSLNSQLNFNIDDQMDTNKVNNVGQYDLNSQSEFNINGQMDTNMQMDGLKQYTPRQDINNSYMDMNRADSMGQYSLDPQLNFNANAELDLSMYINDEELCNLQQEFNGNPNLTMGNPDNFDYTTQEDFGQLDFNMNMNILNNNLDINVDGSQYQQPQPQPQPSCDQFAQYQQPQPMPLSDQFGQPANQNPTLPYYLDDLPPPPPSPPTRPKISAATLASLGAFDPPTPAKGHKKRMSTTPADGLGPPKRSRGSRSGARITSTSVGHTQSPTPTSPTSTTTTTKPARGRGSRGGGGGGRGGTRRTSKQTKQTKLAEIDLEQAQATFAAQFIRHLGLVDPTAPHVVEGATAVAWDVMQVLVRKYPAEMRAEMMSVWGRIGERVERGVARKVWEGGMGAEDLVGLGLE